MGVATEHLNRNIRLHGTDGFPNSCQSIVLAVNGNRIVANDKEQINVVASNRLLEPLLLDHVSSRRHNGGVAVASEIEQDTESHDAKAMLGREVAVQVSGNFILLGIVVVDLDVAGDVLLAVDRTEVDKSLLGNVGVVQLVVSNGENIVVNLLEDRVRDLAVETGGITETGTVVQITCQQLSEPSLATTTNFDAQKIKKHFDLPVSTNNKSTSNSSAFSLMRLTKLA